MEKTPATVLEMPEFIRLSTGLLSEDELRELIFDIASNPEKGNVMAETGGVRKLRWAREGSGKSGGVRVIYYHYNDSLPIFLLTIYPKSVKEDLSKAQKNQLRKLVPILIRTYQEGRMK